jgi:sugar phosphate isomerase/epimerase
MIIPGLVSITFRKLAPAAIVDLVRRAGLAAIEWGGDIHVPHGDLKRAAEVARLTREAGLTVSSYGSYYEVGHSEEAGLTFVSVLATAAALNAPLIRIWAGKQGSAAADAAYRQKIADEARRLADMAQAAGRTLAFEFHGRTLTDTADSARQLLDAIRHPSIFCYWQPQCQEDFQTNLNGLTSLLPWLANIHLFHWNQAWQRLPLRDGAEPDRQYLATVATTGRTHYALLEFVRDDSPDAFLKDAQTLRAWLAHK